MDPLLLVSIDDVSTITSSDVSPSGSNCKKSKDIKTLIELKVLIHDLVVDNNKKIELSSTGEVTESNFFLCNYTDDRDRRQRINICFFIWLSISGYTILI